MGLFDKVKKVKDAKWNVDKRPTLVDLTETHIHCERSGKEFDIFYDDIKDVEKKLYQIKIKTNLKKYELTPRKVRGGKDLADEFYDNLISKMSEVKK